MKLRSFELFSLALASAAPALAAHGPSPWTTIALNVGKGVTAGAQVGRNAVECTDSSRCVLDVRISSVVEFVAQSTDGNLSWTGCTRLIAPNRCIVDVNREPVVVTVQ